MKRMGWIVGLALLAGGVATNAFAWSVAVDVPVAYTLNSTKFSANGLVLDKAEAQSVSGVKVAVKLPFFLGLAYESYTAGFNIPQNSLPTGVTSLKFLGAFKIYDLFVELPMHVVHIGLGAGMGEVSGSTDPGNVAVFKPAAVTQVFATLGLPIGSVLDVHIGYHMVNVADMDVTPSGTNPDKLRLSGNMLSAGIRLGY